MRWTGLTLFSSTMLAVCVALAAFSPTPLRTCSHSVARTAVLRMAETANAAPSAETAESPAAAELQGVATPMGRQEVGSKSCKKINGELRSQTSAKAVLKIVVDNYDGTYAVSVMTTVAAVHELVASHNISTWAWQLDTPLSQG